MFYYNILILVAMNKIYYFIIISHILHTNTIELF